MGAYERNPRNGFRSDLSMPNREIGSLVNEFSGLEVRDSSKDGLIQIKNAVEAAENLLRRQVEENNKLRIKLKRTTKELESYKSSAASFRSSANDSSSEQNGLLLGVIEEQVRKTDNNKVDTKLELFPSTKGGDPLTSHLSSETSRSFSPERFIKEDYGNGLELSTQGTMQISDLNTQYIQLKQDLVLKIREHEEEIAQLRRHLAEYAIKEAQIHKEKCILEQRIAQMRMVFDQQQHDLVDAASKALAYRQDIIEENIHLTYALEVAHNERSIFVSFLVPLLTEYGLQPSVLDAQSIVSSLKVLFKHLQEKLSLTEAKLKESQIPLKTLWQPLADDSNFTQSPFHPQNKNILHIVPQQSYPQGQSSTPIQANPIWKPPENNNIPFVGETTPEVAVENNFPGNRLSGTEMYGDDRVETSSGNEGLITEESNPVNLGLVTVHRGTDSLSPEEDDPLPAIESLQIQGEAFPGQWITACGISINGTTTCTFEWVRHLEDGSINYIEGANHPQYLVTADDVDTYLAIKILPLDNRKRKGDLVTLFANNQNKIMCDAEMCEEIEKTILGGHASYRVLLAIGFLDFWEPATLIIKKEGFSIKSHGTADVNITEKFSSRVAVTIPSGHPTEFVIQSSSGSEQILQTEQNGPSRDTIVLIMRFFIKAREKKRRKRGFFK